MVELDCGFYGNAICYPVYYSVIYPLYCIGYYVLQLFLWVLGHWFVFGVLGFLIWCSLPWEFGSPVPGWSKQQFRSWQRDRIAEGFSHTTAWPILARYYNADGSRKAATFESGPSNGYTDLPKGGPSFTRSAIGRLQRNTA